MLISDLKSVKNLAWLGIFLAILTVVELRPQKSMPNVGAKCGYASCPKPKPHMLNVHLVPHTHDDVGWLKTVDQYYYGSQTLIQKAGVQYILDSVIVELLKDPKKRFIYVESAFFFKWWSEQSDEMKQKVRMLVDEGRLEFIGGAWSMNDEATTHYQSVIDQFAWGLRRLNDTFGECGRPRIGWQIDPFGHSREMASMFAQMGFDGLFFGRLDYQDKDERLMTKTAEMIWRASANLDESSHLFTGALYNQYQPPPGFCFDILCADEPIIDGKHSPDNNVKRRVDEFLKIALEMAEGYRSKNILVTMGEDFHYQNANMWYKNLDKLIKYANERQANGSNINLLYSTPSCYLKALHDAGITWPTKDDDFFPYASDPHAYWTGYFTSRPTIKRYERMGNNFLQVCKQLTTLTPNLHPELLPHLGFMRETMGVMQHHDAVTGTEKQKVAYDYARHLSVAMRACSANARSVLNVLVEGDSPRPKRYGAPRPFKFEFKTCSLLNISSCDVSEQSERFVLTLYNPLGHTTDEYVRLPVPDVNYVVKDYKDVVLDIQYVPVAEPVQNLTFRESQAKYELIFLASELPAFGYKSYYITKSNGHHMKPVPDPENMSSLIDIGNEFIRLTFDTNGFLANVESDGVSRIVSQEFLYYEAAIGDNREFANRSSGAYIFRPKADRVRTVTVAPEITVYRGDLVEEVHQKFNDWISQVIRVYKGQRYAEFEWLVGPIPIEDGVGKEIITRFNADIKSEGIFYTDSNGREMIKRLKDHRDTWRVKLLEHTAGNYYPVTTKIALEDEHARLAILTDRAQGGSSLADGSLELMVHRRLLHDDAFGVDESLNETAYGQGLVARGKHYLIFGSSQLDQSPTLQAVERFTQLEKTVAPWTFLSPTNYSYTQWRQRFTNIFTAMSASLPQNIHLLTFEPWHDHEILVRFEHLLEKDEDPEFSKFVQFNVKSIFGAFQISNMRETTLDGNAWLDENRRMEFVPDPEEDSYESYAIFSKAYNYVQLQKAERPMVSTQFYDELLPAGKLGAESNRLKREMKSPRNQELNRMRSEKLKRIKYSVGDLPLEMEGDRKFLIELSAMQIRTFIITLGPVKEN
ncbi:lysosomal alpha-mannosidase isoform X2 [Musca domestica]|uniref:Alpha-mannosidase n=1 Tax=Musca domestica TaxID=7370 RepID=A0A1I8M2X3_MUSDO|nr:lysosomal alpha-mannosidase isoform X2 [Musca domestica]